MMFKKIILLWQQFKFKTEMFFVLSVLSAVLSYPSEKAMLVAGFLLPAVFIGK